MLYTKHLNISGYLDRHETQIAYIAPDVDTTHPAIDFLKCMKSLKMLKRMRINFGCDAAYVYICWSKT